MPYNWTKPASRRSGELHLWPHQSLTRSGYARFIGLTAVLMAVPLLIALGSVILWGILPFVAAALFGVKWALDKSRRDRRILEVLTLGAENARLERINPGGQRQSWECNRHWARVEMHDDDGPVPHYVTLRGGGREVEIGAFLCEEERLALYDDLKTAFAR